MTPAQLERHMQGRVAAKRSREREALILAWHIQAMAPERQPRGRMPNLSVLLGIEKGPPVARRQRPQQMRSAMLAFVSANGGTVVKHTGPLPEIRRLPN